MCSRYLLVTGIPVNRDHYRESYGSIVGVHAEIVALWLRY